MKVLVINSGSSSIKFQVFDAGDFHTFASGKLEKIGESESVLNYRWEQEAGTCRELTQTQKAGDHEEGFSRIFTIMQNTGVFRDEKEFCGIGHRVVHGGARFTSPEPIDDEVINKIRSLIPLAPLHNPSNLLGIEITRKRFANTPQVAVFDTAFHQTMPPHAYIYGLPFDFYEEHNIRKYGFHGTSHACVARKAAEYLGKPLETLNLITLHLGNGASATAVRDGQSIDTSMGMTPLEGLVMGTRCGDIDPAILFFLNKATGRSIEELESILFYQSGLKGICGLNDMRDIERSAAEGNERARLAIEVYCYRIKKYIGAYLALLGKIDALVFTGGIGENSSLVRKRSCDALSALGIVLDENKNRNASGDLFEIQKKGKTKVLVVKTDEEAEIAMKTVMILNSV